MRPADNPFEMTRIESVAYRMHAREWAALDRRLVANRYRGAIVGPHGSGKTTLLETLAPKLADRGLDPVILRYYDQKRSMDGADISALRAANRPTAAILIDGGEVLSLRNWWTLRYMTRHAGGLIMTSHGAGRLPTVHQCVPSVAILSDVAHAIAPAYAPAFAADYGTIYRDHDGNIRDALRHLYDRCASM